MAYRVPHGPLPDSAASLALNQHAMVTLAASHTHTACTLQLLLQPVTCRTV